MELPIIPTRSCGECNACCKVYFVPAVGKLDGNWCHHCVIGKGCSIYDQRPYECQRYRCMWLANLKMSDDFRPDRIGILIDIQEIRLGDRTVGVLQFWEMKKHALQQPIIKRMMLANMIKGFVVVSRRAISESSYDKLIQMDVTLFTQEEAEILYNLLNE